MFATGQTWGTLGFVGLAILLFGVLPEECSSPQSGKSKGTEHDWGHYCQPTDGLIGDARHSARGHIHLLPIALCACTCLHSKVIPYEMLYLKYVRKNPFLAYINSNYKMQELLVSCSYLLMLAKVQCCIPVNTALSMSADAGMWPQSPSLWL